MIKLTDNQPYIQVSFECPSIHKEMDSNILEKIEKEILKIKGVYATNSGI